MQIQVVVYCINWLSGEATPRRLLSDQTLRNQAIAIPKTSALRWRKNEDKELEVGGSYVEHTGVVMKEVEERLDQLQCVGEGGSQMCPGQTLWI